MNHEFLKLKSHPNLMNKLKNSLSDLDFYEQRIRNAGFCSHLPANALNEIQYWRQRIKDADPSNADELFHSCWRFVHDFDSTLRKCNK